MGNVIKSTCIFTLITLVAGGLLGFTHEVTKEPIARQEQLAKEKALSEVFEVASRYEQVETDAEAWSGAISDTGLTEEEVTEAYRAESDNGNVLGYVLSGVSKEGYGGDIAFVMGVENDGTVTGISFLSLSETAGLGMNAQKPEFKEQFADKKADSFTYTKDGAAAENEIDAISGATITTRAVTNGVNAGLAVFQTCLKGGQKE